MKKAEVQCQQLFKKRIRQFASNTPQSADTLSEEMYCRVMENILSRILAGTNPVVSERDRKTAHTKILKWKTEALQCKKG